MKHKLVIIGAGGHGRVVYDAAKKQGTYEILGFVDQSVPVGTIVIDGAIVIATQSEYVEQPRKDSDFIVAIGNNAARAELYRKLIRLVKPATIIHPAAVIGTEVVMGNGCVFLAQCVINTGARIGDNCIVNNFALVDHDTTVADHCHIERGSLLGPACRVSESVSTGLSKVYAAFTEITA